jgi:hypothetical protein
MLSLSKIKQEITDPEWVIMWERFKKDADQVLSELVKLADQWLDRPYEPSMWNSLHGICQLQPKLKNLIEKSGSDHGWIGNPIPLLQELIQTVAESTDLEIREKSRELNSLRQKAEELWTVD